MRTREPGPAEQARSTCRLRCLFCDWDDLPGPSSDWTDAAIARIAEAGLPEPSLLVESGHGVHAYWRFTEPIADLAEWSQLQKALIHAVRSDASIHDPPRIMRLPGLLNVKNEPYVPCFVSRSGENRYTVDDLRDRLSQHLDTPRTKVTAKPPDNGRAANHPDVLADAARYAARVPAVCEGEGRNKNAFVLAAALTNDFGLCDADAWPIVERWNAANKPPLDDAELRSVFGSARKHAKEPRGCKLVDRNLNNGPDHCESTHGRNGHTRSGPNGRPPSATALTPSGDGCSPWLTENRTDAAAARRLARQFGRDLRYVDPWDGKWLHWDGKRWAIDQQRAIDALAKQLAAALWQDVQQAIAREADGKFVQELIRYARTSNGANGVRNTIALARSEPGIAILPEALDRDPWLFNLENGTLDLRTGKLRPHDRADYITKLAPVVFDPAADCPRWRKFLDDIFAGNAALIAFMRRLMGYTLTGRVAEHVLPTFYGIGSNGKSTLCTAFLDLMGEDYAIQGASDLLLVKKGESHPTELRTCTASGLWPASKQTKAADSRKGC